MTTITLGEVTLTPALVLGFNSSRTAGNVLHTIVGRAGVDVTTKPAGLRSGTLRLLAATLADALSLEWLHAQAGVFSLVDADLPELSMDYVPSGAIRLELDDETRVQWSVEIDYQEVFV
jgi:hypothetical protein